MGFKNNKRDRQNLKRKQEGCHIKESILIVCEGEKTEPNYFKSLRERFKSKTIKIEIDEKSDSTPISVIKYAINKAEQNPESYDIIYCVIDRDRHNDFAKALDKIPKTKKYGAKFYAILSVPCFEFWLLLHFAYTTKNFYAQGEQSPCENLITTELKKYLPKYAKNYKDFSKIITDENLDKAIKTAKQICKNSDINNSEDKEILKYFINEKKSFTNAFLVVEKFKEIS